MEKKYYQLLKENYPNKEAVLSEIINASAICELPKGTEHFVSDLHGEFYAFDHVLRNGSGGIKEKIKECFPKFTKKEMDELAVLIYYPEEKLSLQAGKLSEEELTLWYQKMIPQLLKTAKFAGRKYTRSKVRKSVPKKFRYIIEELMSETNFVDEKEDYYASIMKKIVALNQAVPLIKALSYAIRRLTIDHLHVVGDIYDRGLYPDYIMERLMGMSSIDIQWGNHDIIWMAAYAGSPLAMMNVLRICARYGNLDIIEERYGIYLRPLIDYAKKYYKRVKAFDPKLMEGEASISEEEKEVLCVVQQATAILQFKLEAQLIKRRPEFKLDDRDLLNAINYETQMVIVEGEEFPLKDFQAPTIDSKQPELLTEEEESILKQLLKAFRLSEKFARHMEFLLEKGSMYLCYNGNLLIHGCIPLHDNGDFKSLRIENQSYAGKELLDFFEYHVRKSMNEPSVTDDFSTDVLWYLWLGENSSLFGKHAMKTFERYYIEDKRTHKENKNAYYELRNNPQIIKGILSAFGLGEEGHIINGHTPVKEKDGENPIKAQGKMIVIDGGFSKAYQKTTGIAGYTLLSNSYGMQLVAHQAFSGVKDAVERATDIISVKRLVEQVDKRTKVKDTNIGKKLLLEINDLEYLFENYDFI